MARKLFHRRLIIVPHTLPAWGRARLLLPGDGNEARVQPFAHPLRRQQRKRGK
jgi:hypothetical protein